MMSLNRSREPSKLTMLGEAWCKETESDEHMAKNYYLILGVGSQASQDEIKWAYRRQAKEYHPDHYGADSAPFMEVQEAYSVLGDPNTRAAYDQSLRRAWRPAAEPFRAASVRAEPFRESPARGGAEPISLLRSFETFSPSFDEIFDRLWSNFFEITRPKAETVKGVDVDIPLRYEQAQQGGEVQIVVPALLRCATCRGSGAVGEYGCWRCAGRGVLTDECPVRISYPPGIPSSYVVKLSLDRYGIRNSYLTVRFRVTVEDFGA